MLTLEIFMSDSPKSPRYRAAALEKRGTLSSEALFVKGVGGIKCELCNLLNLQEI